MITLIPRVVDIKVQTSAKNCLATPAKALKLPNRL
jgi:hypothetical protein